MKRNFKLIGIIALIVILIIVYLFLFVFQNKKEVNEDANKFKEEYESLNGKKNEDGKSYLEIEISNDNVIDYTDYKEVFDILDDGTGIIYFGFPECPWCRNLVKVLMDAANEVGVEKIFYLNNREDRDTRVLENNKIVVEKEGTEDYFKLVNKLDNILGEYKGLNDKSIKRLYFPTVIFVVEGKVVKYNIGTVDSQIDPYTEMTESQTKELRDKLIEGMEEIISCTSAC
ncbi:MAG: hypothetical protein PHQ64_03590 [Bacilli bacterium]|nr:hypothetical protein [Bacilli bacterium]